MNIKKVLLIVLIITLVIDAVAIIWFKSNESKILFDPIIATMSPIPYSDVEYKDITITTKDSVTLKGWEIYAANNDSITPWLIYFHDRNQNVSSNIVEYLQLRNLGMNILAVDYRGFGESEGEINEAGMYLDADAIFNYIRYKKDIPYNRTIIYGEGLGTAVAIDLGQNVNAGALILVNAFTSAPDLLQDWYPFAWPKLFTNFEMNSIDKIKNINTPKFFVSIPEKSCVTVEYSDQLYDNSKKYHWRLEAEPYDGINQNTYYNNLVELLNKNARFTLWTPPASLADTLMNTYRTQGIVNALRQYSDIIIDTTHSYDLSEYQLDYLGDKLLEEDKMQEALEFFTINAEAYPESENAQYKKTLTGLENNSRVKK